MSVKDIIKMGSKKNSHSGTVCVCFGSISIKNTYVLHVAARVGKVRVYCICFWAV